MTITFEKLRLKLAKAGARCKDTEVIMRDIRNLCQKYKVDGMREANSLRERKDKLKECYRDNGEHYGL